MATLEVTEFVTIEGLPLCETGIDYPASTGPISLTTSMFSSAVEFAQDPHGLAPRIKISHGLNPIDADLQSLFDQYNSERDASEPSLGTILNLRTENSGHTLVGDWYGLPRWLAEILQSAYPARSIEGGAWQNPANQKTYDFMIEACVLLGVVGPGCTSLADIQELFSASGPEITVIEMSSSTKTSTKMGGKLRMPAALQVNVEDIRRDFYQDFAQGDRYWWWDRELLSDPWEFICSDDNGDLWRVPFEVEEDEDGDTLVTSWGEPQPIKIQYTPDAKRSGDQVAATRMISSQIPGAGVLLAVNDAPFRRKEEKPAMGIDISALRERLSISEEDLPDDATDEQINAALAATPDEDESEETEESPDEEAAAVAASKNGDTVQVHRDVWDRTVRGAELAVTQQQERDRSDNDTFLETAIREGRITRASKKNYLTEMNGPGNTGCGPARDSLREMISKLEKGVSMPIDEVGHGEGAGDHNTIQAGTGLFPKLDAAREARARQEV